MALSSKLARLRRDRGWSVWEASKACDVHPYIIRSIEGNGSPRVTHASRVSVQTVSKLVKGFWPDLGWEDFSPDDGLRFEREDAA